MRFWYLTIFLSLWLCITPLKADETGKIAITPYPEGIVAKPVNLNFVLDKKKIRDGREYLLSEVQTIHLDARPRYFLHTAVRVHNQSAIEEESRIALLSYINFQTVELHELRVYRDDEIINLKDNFRTQVIRDKAPEDIDAEREYEVIILHLPDIRPGDVIEYAYSVNGVNPAFGEHIFGEVLAGGRAFIHDYSTKVVVPKDSHIDLKLNGGADNPVIVERGEHREYVWDVGTWAQPEFESGTPIWYPQIPHVVYTDFQNWGDVSEWGQYLFRLSEESVTHTAIVKLSEELAQQRREKTDLDQLIVSLGFVQAEIRYLGPEIGRNGFIPFPPEDVLNLRYGDCKDNAQLLVALLRARGIEAWPALVHSNGGKIAEYYGPSPLSFNHVIVYAVVDGVEYWLDPTRRLARGKSASLHPALFGKALVLKAGETGLREITPVEAQLAPNVSIKNFFDISGGYAKPGYFTYEASYREDYASYIRNLIERHGQSDYSTALEEEFSSYIPDITEVEPLDVYDQFDDNRIDYTISYQIEKPWSYNEDKQLWYFYQTARYLSKSVYAPKNKSRKTPFALSYPLKIKEEIEFRLPEWDFKDDIVEFKRNYHKLTSKIYYESQTLHVEYVYETLSDHVPADEYQQFFEDITNLKRSAWYSVYFNQEKQKHPSLELEPIKFEGLNLEKFKMKTVEEDQKTDDHPDH